MQTQKMILRPENNYVFLILSIVEEVKLIGEGEYNLNDLKEIRVTESYLGLDQEDRGCQNEEPLINCTTRKYNDTLLGECGCLPFNIRIFHQVYFFKMCLKTIFTYSRKNFALHHKSCIVRTM